MRYIDENLTEGEVIRHRGKVHWIVYAPAVSIIAISFLILVTTPLGLGPKTEVLWSSIALWGAGFPLLIRAWIRRITTELAVTSKRFIAKFGWISRRTVELGHAQFESLSVSQTVVGRFLDYGTLTLHGTGGVITPIPRIDRPLEFRRRVLEVLE